MRRGVPVPVVAGVAVAVGALVAVVDGQGTQDLCDPATAFREWRKVVATEPCSPDRLKVAPPVAAALVGCERPLIGMSRDDVEARLGRPDRGYRSKIWAYDLGMAERESIRPGMLVVFTRDGRVRSATAGE